MAVSPRCGGIVSKNWRLASAKSPPFFGEQKKRQTRRDRLTTNAGQFRDSRQRVWYHLNPRRAEAPRLGETPALSSAVLPQPHRCWGARGGRKRETQMFLMFEFGDARSSDTDVGPTPYASPYTCNGASPKRPMFALSRIAP